MSILDSEYFYDVYCSKLADECNNLKDALSCYCDECGHGADVIRYYVERHEKDENFETEVEYLGYSKIAQLLDILLPTKYDIRKPWYKRQCLSLLGEDDKDLTAHEIHWKRIIANIYDYYKKGFDKVDETLD